MLKTWLYMTLGIVGVIAALLNPLYGAVAIIESYLFTPTVFSPELLSFRFQFNIAIAFMLGLLMHGMRSLPKVHNEGRINYLLIAYGLVGLSSTLWAVKDPDVAWRNSIDIGKTILVSLLIFRSIGDEKSFRTIIYAILVGVAHCAFMYIVGANIGWVPKKLAREFGILPDMQASVMTYYVPLFVLFSIYGRTIWTKLFSLVGLLLILDAIVNSYQRAYFVALLVEMAFLVVILPKRIVLRLIPAMLVGVLAFVFVFSPDDYWEQMKTILDNKNDGSAQSRFAIADASMKMFADYPWGVGYRNYPQISPRYLTDRWLTDGGQRAAHNTFFTVLCELGIVGFSLLMGAVGYALWLLRRVRKLTNMKQVTEFEAFAMSIEVGLIGWLVGGLFHSDHEVDPIYWSLALTPAIVRIQMLLRQPPPDPNLFVDGADTLTPQQTNSVYGATS
ncbi:O-antigen ligase family protein [Rhodopirellula sp. MGV]|uniref:O-antigen ligase family protein n=1 Tax=Rhodopirellula sp. MGV TaxID=2023130 RepID=UPI000B96C78E|nr:O-antigen ligase family protein [Rhodopirellula sp. MGV]OYP33022.1 hypothetical protein CGZ80_19225 [Rhodopirellula sp. MGV]PNY35315.1 hypothetical protein C2E31_17455 [Rhodopirellula baltica]